MWSAVTNSLAAISGGINGAWPNEIPQADIDRWSIDSDTPAGRLRHLGPTVRLSETPPYWARPSVPLGYNQPAWPARAA
jgi:hypothetical protein